MRAASLPIQRPRDARLLVVDRCGRIDDLWRASLDVLPRPGDCVIANDAATLPASLAGVHLRTDVLIEVRLAGRASLDGTDVSHFSAIVFGAGDFHTPTEARPAPPPLRTGDRLAFGPALSATVVRLHGHPRFVELHFDGDSAHIWQALAEHGKPVQYAHLPDALALWDTWTPFAAHPVAFEAPSAGFALDWRLLDTWRARGVAFATLTHAAGLSSTGDAALDRLLPLDEPYRIPPATATLIAATRARHGRVIAIGTTVVRALEHAARQDGSVRAGDGVATQRIGPDTVLRVVDVLLSGTHEPDTSHYQLLHAFAGRTALARVTSALESHDYRTHEFGDSVWLERAARGAVATEGCGCNDPQYKAPEMAPVA